ncbi:GNAT family N-acetyltransferase [Jejudonia soesokkakensis]|uniref:GNAT family N-acetyltransferase n=1 Tax=Jejudonia soesokkakensis TaxID=1323432 RepID=A0ABW2MWL5_9FLAO
MGDYIITTKRFGLRNWKENDIEPFAEMCADPKVMKYFPSVLSETETKQLVSRLQNHFEEYRFTYFAIEALENQEFLGFTGLMKQTWESEFTPCVDLGWRLKQSAWGKGIATEAAKACIDYAFSELKLKELYAFAAKGNIASEQVMKKLGMTFQGNFIHPKIKDDPRFPYCFAYKIENL